MAKMKIRLSKQKIFALSFLITAILAGALFALKIVLKNQVVSENGKNDLALEDQTTPKNEWSYYHDEKYGYRVLYPSDLYIKKQQSGDEVNFIDNIEFGYLTIWVGRKDYASLDSWLKDFGDDNESRVFEKKINIDGYEAWIAYEQNKLEILSESSRRDRSIAFIKNRKLYEIFTRAIDYEKVLNSFKFE